MQSHTREQRAQFMRVAPIAQQQQLNFAELYSVACYTHGNRHHNFDTCCGCQHRNSRLLGKRIVDSDSFFAMEWMGHYMRTQQGFRFSNRRNNTAAGGNTAKDSQRSKRPSQLEIFITTVKTKCSSMEQKPQEPFEHGCVTEFRQLVLTYHFHMTRAAHVKCCRDPMPLHNLTLGSSNLHTSARILHQIRVVLQT